MAEETMVPEQAHQRMQELQAEVQQLRQEERQVKEEIAALQAELSRSRARDRQRAQVIRSASLPPLQIQQRRLGAEIFRREQEIRALREQLEPAESP